MRRLSVLVLSVAVLAAGAGAVVTARRQGGSASARTVRVHLVSSISGRHAGSISAPRPAPKVHVNPRVLPRSCFVAGGECGLRPCVEFLGSAAGQARPASTGGSVLYARTAGRPKPNRSATRCRPAPGSYRVAGVLAGATSSPVSFPATTAASPVGEARTAQATRGAS